MNKFLYLIKTNHYIKIDDTFVPLIGYGITSNPERRLNSYIGVTGTVQEFCQLYWGPADAIQELEKFQKQSWRHESITIDDWVLEWLDPTQKKTINDLEKFFENKIKRDRLPILKVKQDFMPYTRGFPSPVFVPDDLVISPDNYLDQIV